jgi:methionyl-tRNA formyltransferase
VKVHLISTDESCFELLQLVNQKVELTAVIIPENRLAADKINLLIKRADSINIPVLTHERGKSYYTKTPKAELGVSWFYSQIISSQDLESYPLGIINMHGGKIPEYRGASVLQWVIINGENEIGVTWHSMVENVDAGPIWSESNVKILDEMNAADVRGLIIKKGLEDFPNALTNLLDNSNKGKIPNLSNGNTWPQRTVKDSKLRPGLTAKQVKDLVRAVPEPWPPPKVFHNNEWIPFRNISSHHRENSIKYLTKEGETIYIIPITETVHS